MSTHHVTERKIQAVLIAGFSLVILLLVAAGFVGVFNVQSIRHSASSLVAEQLFTTRLIDEIQREQAALSAVFHRLARDPETVDRARVLAQLDTAAAAIHRTVSAAASNPEAALWRELEAEAAAFSDEARRFLSEPADTAGLTRRLVRQHDAVIATVSRLVSASYQKASDAQRLIETRSNDLVRQSSLLLGACLLLALLFTVLTVQVTAGLFRRMEAQASELSRVSWQMLDKQETAARRFSHELHDELGQAMTALKANLVSMELPAGPARERRDDCLHLVDEAIGNIRELSQLLRPTILDDFGLEAGIRWLAERFTTRTGIQAECRSDLGARLPEETETHLFRIAQEALTNVARHSGARRVWIALTASDHTVRLRIADDGKGLAASGGVPGGLGMIGMRARARSVGGELEVGPAPEGGVRIQVTLPLRTVLHATKDPDLVSR